MLPMPPSRNKRNNMLVALLLVLVSVASLFAVSFVTLTGSTTPSTATPITIPQGQAQPTSDQAAQLTIEYDTEAGLSSQEGVVNSPLQITVRMPQPNSYQVSKTSINLDIQLLDDAGRPALYGGSPTGPATMAPAFENGAWVYYSSVPGNPGTYHAQISVHVQRTSLDNRPALPIRLLFDLEKLAPSRGC